MYCKRCGAENSEENRFCEKCGKPLFDTGKNVDANEIKGFLFDETNPIWYKIIKALIIICTVILLASGVIALIGITVNTDFLLGLITLVICWITAILGYVFAMVGLNYIRNVNTIREILEKNAEEK